MSTRQILIDAKALIDTPEKWCQKNWARDADGCVVSPTDATANRFCIEGALRNVANGDRIIKIIAGGALEKVVGCLTIWNDDPARTHDEVMQAFDRAIEAADE